MRCIKCGHDSNGHFCTNCGEKLENIKGNQNMDLENKQQKKKNNKNLLKLMICIFTIFIIVVGLFFLIKSLFFKKTSNNLYNIFDENNLILIEKNNLYGYIDSKGKTVIEPKYNKASDFYGDYTLVAVKNEESATGFEYQIIDKKGKTKYKTNKVYDISYISDYDLWIIEGTLYNGKMQAITSKDVYVNYEDYGYFTFEDYENKNSGVIDSTGKIIFKWNYDDIIMDISDTDIEKHYAEIESYETKDIIISLQTGKILYENPDISKYNIMSEDDNIFKIYDNSSYDTVDYLWFYDEKLAFQLNGDARDISLKTKDILEIDYGYSYEEKYNKTQRRYYYDYKTGKLLEEMPTKEYDMEDIVLGEYIEYSCSSKKGLMKDEKVILPCEYNDIKYINKYVYEYLKSEKSLNLVILSKNNEIELYDLNKNNVVYKFNTTKIYDIDIYASTFIISTNRDTEKKTVYNMLTNKEITFDSDTDIDVYSNYIIVKSDDKTIYYNTKLENIYEI